MNELSEFGLFWPGGWSSPEQVLNKGVLVVESGVACL